MHELIDDMLDLVVTIIILALVVGTGFTISLDNYRKALEQKQEMLEDKNTATLTGYGYDQTDFDNKYTIYDVLLLIQVQDYSMPEPRTVKLVDSNNTVYGSVTMNNNYRETLVQTSLILKTYASTAATNLGKTISSLRYTMKYVNNNTYNSDGSVAVTDQYFAIVCE